MTTSVVDYGYGDTPVDYGYGDATPDTDYGYGDAKPDTDYGYGDAKPDTDYGYGDAKPDTDYGYGDATPDMGYGYGDAKPDTDYGYGEAAPSSASHAEYGYGDAAPDMGYGDASPDADRATELVETKKRPKRRCSVTRYSLVSPTGMVGGEEAAPKDIASTTYDAETGTPASTVGTTSSQSSMSEVESNQHQPSRDIHREQQRLESSGPHNPPGRSHSDAADMYRYASGNAARGGGRRHGNHQDGGGGGSQDGDDHHHPDQQGARGQPHGKGGVMKRMNRIRKRLSLAF